MSESRTYGNTNASFEPTVKQDELLLNIDGMLRKIGWFQNKWLSFDNKDRHYIIKEILAKVKQHKNDDFRRALEQSRKGEPLDLSEEDFELFSSIQNDGIAKAYQKRLDRPDREKEIDGIVEGILGEAIELSRNDYSEEVLRDRLHSLKQRTLPQLLALFDTELEEDLKIEREHTKYLEEVIASYEARTTPGVAKREEKERIRNLLNIPPDDSQYCLGCSLLEAGTSAAYDYCRLYGDRLEDDRNGHKKCSSCKGQALKDEPTGTLCLGSNRIKPNPAGK